MKKWSILVAVFCAAVVANAQPNYKAIKESYDFGPIEEGTQASHTFEITNNGSQPLIISHVQPSCGCTTPDWTKDPIQPGATGKITATYNSEGRPGAFLKQITVTSNTDPATHQLTIKGFVGPKTEGKTYTDTELKNSPVVSLERQNYNFGKVEVGQAIRQKIKLTNKGKSTLKISGVQVGCYCVTYQLAKPEIAPLETVDLELIYSPKSEGEQTDIVTLSTNDISKKTVVTLQATVLKKLNEGSILKQSNSDVPFK